MIPRTGLAALLGLFLGVPAAAETGDTGRAIASFVAAQVSSRTESGMDADVSVRAFGYSGLDAEAASVWAEEFLALEQALVAVPGLRLREDAAAAAFLVSGEVRPLRDGLWVRASVVRGPEGYVVALASFTSVKQFDVARLGPARAEPAPLLQRLMRRSASGKGRTTYWAGVGTQTDLSYLAFQGVVTGRLDERWQAGLRISNYSISREEGLAFPAGYRRTTVNDLSIEGLAARLFEFRRGWLPGVGGFPVRWAVSAGAGLRWDLFQKKVYQSTTPPLSPAQILSPENSGTRVSPFLDLGLSWHATKALDLETGFSWAAVSGRNVTGAVALPTIQARLALVLRLL
ncbi:MAG: hypothetical protein HY928_16405 [Elusimicrobia bacterium]|nr:hypothetical protein [Elusimicrobiota bacterium]